jgi:hypothetical protein
MPYQTLRRSKNFVDPIAIAVPHQNLALSFAKTPAGFKISKIRQPRVTCYLDEF